MGRRRAQLSESPKGKGDRKTDKSTDKKVAQRVGAVALLPSDYTSKHIFSPSCTHHFTLLYAHSFLSYCPPPTASNDRTFAYLTPTSSYHLSVFPLCYTLITSIPPPLHPSRHLSFAYLFFIFLFFFFFFFFFFVLLLFTLL